MEKYDTSQLTEFPRFESDSNQGGVSTFLTKLWKFPIFTPTETAENQESKLPSDANPNEQTNVDGEKEYEDKMETGSYVEEYEGRSLPNILKRISGLVALGSGSGTKYSDTDLARYWMPDDISRECYECAARFSTLRRRHHCRVCGQIFCSRCCSQRVPGQIFGCAGGLRVCTYCCKVVLTYLRENDLTGDISPDLKTLQESLQVKFPENKSQSHKSRDFIFAREQEPCEVRSSSKEALHDVYRMLYFALPTQLHRYRLVRYNNVWRGCDIMQWLMDNTSHKTRAQATLFCQSLLSAGCMERVTEPPQFADYALYRPVHVQAGDGTDTAPDEECKNRLVESVSSYCLDLNLGNSSARLIKATKTEPPSTPSSEEDHPILDHQEKCTKPACKAIEQSGGEHLRLLVRQWLARAALAPAWLHALYPLCVRAAECIVLDMMSSDIDVRNYVQVKKVPGGSMSDSCLVNGVVITKNVAHRGMPKKIKNPSVLLLDCSITYQRVEGKLTSLEPLLMQEQEYLVRCAARIAALQPSVVLVRGSTARAVQDSLRARGVALALGVRDRALKRAARATKADLVASIDARIGTPRLGTCEQFYVNSYSSKTLMVLEGCAEPQLGCCILLRGGSLQELIRVKRLVKFMLLACYNWKLEKAFLADIEAILPEPGTFVDDDIENESEVKDITKNTRINSQNNDDGNSSNDTSEADDIIFGNNPNLSKDTKPLNSDKIESRNGNDKQESDKTGDKKDIQETEEQLKETDMEKSIEIDDPLQKSKQFSRKTDSDKNLSCGVPIKDFSDPLQSRLSIEDDVFLPKEEAKLKADSQNERWCTDDIVLSMSPNIVIPAPTLPLARPAPAAPAPSHPPHTPRASRKGDSRPVTSSRPESPRPTLHPFVEHPITAPADDPALRASLAHFRATGCSIVGNHKPQCTKYNTSIVKKVEAEETKSSDPEPLDPLSPENHQRLSVLLYSYSSKSPNVPDFCMNPWVVTMEMYGRNDISLGAFLEKYCFNGDNKCPSTNCHIPMNQHERKFVHEDVCITITCNTIGHSNVDKVKEEQSKQVMFWSRCERCGAVSRGARLSRAALSLSLAQYVRARVSAPRYRRPQCAHACHAHSHAFVSRLTTACFKYNKIATYSVQLPPDVISINYDTRLMRDALIAHLNDLMLRGHEAFSNATEPDGEKAYAAFKQHMEQIHLALTTDDNNSLAERVRKLWNVHDAIINGEKMLRDSSDAHRHRPAPETTSDDKSDPDEVPDITSIDAAETLIKDSEKEHTGTEEDEEKGDKKTVKQILSQLLSNNQPSNQEGMIITSGVIPVVVKAGEIGSVIAAALASVTYTKTLQSQRIASQNDFEDGENTSSVKEKADGDKAKAKSNDHIEVLLKDGLLCRVYYASQFHKLRHMLLSPLEYSEDARAHWEEAKCCDDVTAREKDNKGLCEIEEGFIRSLAHCVPWAARGGKSGSTFCKTKDDRYVLKEMTKPEWQQFLEFAPHYFNYVTNCRQKKLPSLLARILGVFSVGGAGSGVLVTEHVWYGTNADGTRYDLKGISKPRPLNNAPVHSPDAVLLDDHLLKSRWEHQLAVRGAGARALCGGVERDTRFLADNAVMDYSLLLGVHDGLLVLGIIDYIRTFTWDKKLEHLVKKNLGSGQPTVVSPDQYRRRFQTACAKYFLQCPAHWDHLYADCSYNA